MNGCYVVRETKIELRVGGELKPVRKIIIGYHYPEDNIVYPSPLTDFIHKYYFQYSYSLSNQRQPAITVTQFLNYITEMIPESINFHPLYYRGEFGLTLEHGTMFLNDLTETKGITQKTFSGKVSHLTAFYDYLNENSLLDNKITITKDNSKGKNKPILTPPFKDVQCPLVDNKTGKKKKDFITTANKDRVQLVREFIMTAFIVDPGLALGVAFLFFAGLRMGEVVNMQGSSVVPQNGSLYGESGMVLEIRDTQEELFGHLQTSTNIDVKKPRDQVVLMDPLIPWLYKKHLLYLERLSNKRKIDEKALFVGLKSGKAVDGIGFWRRFNNIKKIYLNSLAETPGRLQDYVDFAETKWSSHIGRGAFTNLVVEAGFTAEQTAVARGDSDLSSALEYTDQMTALHNISAAIDTLSRKDFNGNLIDIPELNKTWREVVHFGKV